MSTSKRFVNAPPGKVWDVLADGWLYPLWVVGAARIRDVDPGWPEVGAQIHHSVGGWPLLLDDTTEVLEAHPPAAIRMRARAWPMGEASVEITLLAEGAGTMVTLSEKVVSGPGALIPSPVTGLSLKWRNTEALRRLALIAENRN